ncbi:hypothetical protein B0H12DRAFT_1094182 [Mycena haematopus]|nr:hypothetical protein B0H12DRAFT_1094182 [Mycena haematopus]
MSSPPSKRKRTEDAPIQRSDIWRSDGSVVLQAENVQFRVHWSVLALSSSFFRELQGLPQPADQPSVDGCPLVELQDSAVDVEYMLTALYDPTFLSQTALPLAAVGALIRLGRKYDFKKLLDPAVARLISSNPATFAEYDALRADGKYKQTCIISYPGYALDLLVLARENNIGSALPVAYYRALRYNKNLTKLLQATQKNSETLASLSSDDLCRCLVGRLRLLTKQFQPGCTLGWLREWQYTDCSSPARCSATRKSKFHTVTWIRTSLRPSPTFRIRNGRGVSVPHVTSMSSSQ